MWQHLSARCATLSALGLATVLATACGSDHLTTPTAPSVATARLAPSDSAMIAMLSQDAITRLAPALGDPAVAAALAHLTSYLQAGDITALRGELETLSRLLTATHGDPADRNAMLLAVDVMKAGVR